MPSIIETILARSGRTLADLPSNSTLGKLTRRKGVPHSSELTRILALPRRQWETDPELPEVVSLMTEWLKTPGGEMELLPVQAQALREICNFGGIVGPIPVGEGKSILAYLAATVLPEKARPILILPANLIEKTEREILHLKRHWRIREDLRIISADLLSSPKQGPTLLDNYLPKLVCIDEAHVFKNLDTARGKRLRRYAGSADDIAWVNLSGTFLEDSLRDIHHFQQWALPEALQPLPRDWPTLKHWADALDEEVIKRMAPGALLEFCQPGESQMLEGVRKAFGRHFAETPGVISVNGSDVGCSLYLEADMHDGYSPTVNEAFETLNGWETPDGWEIPEALQKWAHEGQMALEFYYRLNPRPPKAWMEARQAWGRHCREIANNNRRDLDSEFQIAAACMRGWYDAEPLLAWQKIKPTFIPNHEAIWLGDSVLNRCIEWGEKERGIIWVKHIEFAKRLEKLSGFPYYGAGGLDSNKRSIEGAPKGPIIASIQANSKGRNLQDRWAQNYITIGLGTAKEYEQLMGRTHRRGQKADVVGFTVLLGCLSQYNSLMRAKSRSHFVSDGSRQDRKLLLADWLIPDTLSIARMKGPRWAPKTKKVK